jgi:DNA-binding response OmpR family regulator
MKILIAEDDRNIRKGISDALETEGYETVLAADGIEALDLLQSHSPDLVCLDIMMPRMNGYDVCREIRKQGSSIPVIFISAKSEEIDKVLGLELGADDFIAKPFGLREIVARIRAVSRRYKSTQPSDSNTDSFWMASLEIVPDELRAYREGQTIDLSPRDLEILRILHEKKGHVVDRDLIFQRAWGLEHIPNSRTLDQHISQLRKRIEIDPKHPSLIKTVHGAGYRFDG